MKKTKITNLLKLGILLFGISLLLLSCQEETDIEAVSETKQKKLNVTITSLDHLKIDNNKVVKQIDKYLKKEENSKIISSEHGFYINEERVQIIENESYTTYTFIVERDSLQEGVLENYMYKEFEDETYKQFLLKYYYTLNVDGERVFSTTVLDIEEIIDESLVINKNPTSGDCFPHFVESYLGFICTTSERCSGPGAGGHEVGEAECPCQVTVFNCVRAGIQTCEHTYGYTFDDCSGGGTGNDNVTNPNDPNNPPIGGGGGNPDPDPDPDETDAVPFEEPIDYAQEIITCINETNVIGGSNNQLTQHQIDWLNDATLREIRPLYEYLNENSCSEDAQNTVLIELELKDDIYFLLEVVDCNQILNWQSLVQHNAPQSVIDKLEGFDENTIGDVDIQEIEDASGTVINLDYYPVTVTTLPNNPTTGNQFTADEFLNHIRTNMNDFVDTTITSFEPSTITGYDEEALWSSNNPLTSIIHLDISGGPGDGSVICTSYENTNWIFTTLEVPYNLFLQGYDGEHPVSGNRQFGYTLNSNGSYTFFTRGVDRMTAWFDSAIAESFMDNPFTGAGNLWNSFKEGIYNFTIDHGGTANPVQDSDNSINRPDWDKVKDVLQGNRPISDLGC